MIRTITLEAPLTSNSLLPVADGRTMSVASLAAMTAREREQLVTDEVQRAQIMAACQDIVLPGALRWLALTESASPSSPVWVSALERNARVVQIELARDALADPWQPSRMLLSRGGEISVLGAASRSWRRGDIEFDVLIREPSASTRSGGVTVVRHKLSESDRRRLWEHLTGLILSMEIESGQVDFALPGETSLPVASVGMVGPGVRASYSIDSPSADSAIVREDGMLRLDQIARTQIAEHHAWLVRRWRAEVGPPVIDRIIPVSDYDRIDGKDDLAQRARGFGRAVIAIGAGSAFAVGAVIASRSEAVRGWFGKHLSPRSAA